jgi:polar amino acid transport system substrate-binding protein
LLLLGIQGSEEKFMNRRSVFGICAITVLGLTVILANAIAQQTMLKEQRTTPPITEVRQTLAPLGKLRVGVYSGSPFSMVRDPVSGEIKGMAVELGRALAMRLEVPYEQVEFRRPAEIYQALKAGEIDMTIANATPARVDEFAWSPPLMLIELGFLARAGSPLVAPADVDRPGVRVGVTQGGTMNSALARELKNATVVPTATLKNGIEMLAEHKIDVYATNKANLFEMSDALPGSRVLDGRWGLENLALAIPKGRDAGFAYVRAFAVGAKSEGLVAHAAARVALRGVAAE